jgi:hypothetical protein
MANIKTEPMSPRQVHTSKDYTLFSSLKGNRTINKLHLKRLKKSMTDNYLFTVITVNENYQIIDGQHRFNAIRELELPVNYVICKGYGLKEIQVLNQNSKTWNADDYLTGYCNLGNKHYMKYKEFKNRYGFGHNETMSMLTGYTSGNGSVIDDFRRGNFRITHLKEARAKADKICLFKDLYKGYKRRAFIYALLELMDKDQFEFTEFLSKVKLQPSALTDCKDREQYISLIEEIYNYKRRLKVNLRY